MPCDDCSRAEQCPPCVNEPPKNSFAAPPDSGAFRDFVRQQEVQMTETIINNRCKCSHDRFRHQHPTKTDGSCWEPDCDCMQYAPVTVETVELPEPHECDNCEGVNPDSCPFNRTEPDGNWKHPEGKTHEECPTCWGVSEAECMCCTPALADEPWAIPQPERRPPLTVQYSVAGGHPYEVSIPGDASVTAEDGVLIIKHPSAQILAITRIAPMEGA